MDRFLQLEDSRFDEELAIVAEDDSAEQPSEGTSEPVSLTKFQAHLHDACMNIELAIEYDVLDEQTWQRLRQLLRDIANLAGHFGKIELGLLARELEHGLEILSPRARVRRLRNARSNFMRLVASGRMRRC